MKKVAIYARVSTDGQTVENQIRELMETAQRHQWEVVEIFKDEGISGAKGRDRRPAFDALCRAVTRREIDMVAAWSVDRLGRSLQHLVGFLGELHAKGGDLYLHKQGLDTSTPAGRAMFQMLGVFAEFERAMIQERIKAGLARTKKKLGRPRVADAKRERAVALKETGKTVRTIAKETGLGVGTVHRILHPTANGPL